MKVITNKYSIDFLSRFLDCGIEINRLWRLLSFSLDIHGYRDTGLETWLNVALRFGVNISVLEIYFEIKL